MRRAKQYTKEATTPSFSTGDLTVDFCQHQALRGGEPINLTPTEYRILAYLARNAGRVVTQDDLLTKVWGPAYRDEAHLLRVNIARLRQKVEPEPSKPRYVITRPGIGYSLTRWTTTRRQRRLCCRAWQRSHPAPPGHEVQEGGTEDFESWETFGRLPGRLFSL